MSFGRMALVVVVGTTATLAGCEHPSMDGAMDGGMTEVSDAAAAMDRLLEAYPGQVGFHHDLDHWGFTTPDGDKLEWTSDPSAGALDVAVVLRAQPLVDAGVDPDALVAAGWIYQAATSEPDPLPARLIKAWDVSAAASDVMGDDDTAGAAFMRLLELDPERIGYHDELHHFGYALGGGEKFEWTHDLQANDADLAFVLLAQPLVEAGADVALLEAAGWLHADATETTPELLILPAALDEMVRDPRSRLGDAEPSPADRAPLDRRVLPASHPATTPPRVYQATVSTAVRAVARTGRCPKPSAGARTTAPIPAARPSRKPARIGRRERAARE